MSATLEVSGIVSGIRVITLGLQKRLDYCWSPSVLPQESESIYQDIVNLLLRIRAESEHEKHDPVTGALSNPGNA